ncbi:MAG: methyltransferase domain-containing protein [Ruminococcus flavefaciens]|nr:methyltransferase domain-containing protein [Ruminococcus flavefaciens]
MYEKFQKYMDPKEKDEVLDLGVTPDIKLADSNFFEKKYPYKSKLTIASIEDCQFLADEYGLKGFVRNKPKERLPFDDKQFDILFCSAVLEHVGTRDDQKFFLEECLRISDKIFLTTPNRYFLLEMHTFLPFVHWLPWNVFQKIVRKLKDPFWADINNLNLVSRKDIEKMFGKNKFAIRYIRTLGWKSNLIIIKR